MTARDAAFPEYRERRGRFDRLHQDGDWQLKVYVIDAGKGPPAADLVDAALPAAARLLPDVSERVYGEAFVIVHSGEDAIWLLVHWWQDHCLLYHRVAAATLDNPRDFSVPVDAELIACSWELDVIGFERDAWVRTIQRPGGEPDRVAYRADTMPERSI